MRIAIACAILVMLSGCLGTAPGVVSRAATDGPVMGLPPQSAESARMLELREQNRQAQASGYGYGDNGWRGRNGVRFDQGYRCGTPSARGRGNSVKDFYAHRAFGPGVRNQNLRARRNCGI